DGSSGRSAVDRLLRLYSALSDLLGAKTCRLDSARAASIGATVALSGLGDAVAETCAGDGSFNPCFPTRTVSRTRARRQIERTCVGHGQVSVGLALTRDAIGIAESAGLHFLYRCVDRRDCRTAKLTGVHHQRGTRARYLFQHSGFEIVHYDLGRRDVGLLLMS